MQFRHLALLSLASAAANGKTIDIDVGEDGLVFSPDPLPAADKGDILKFHFYPSTGPHSVVSSTFEKPCVPNEGAFFSGLLEGTASGSQTFEVEVQNTDPIWFYCSASKHCQAGMVGVVNPPSDKTSSQYAAAAAKVVGGSAPSAPTGGFTSSASSPSSTSAVHSSVTSVSSSVVSSVNSVTSSIASSVSSVASSVSSQAASATSSAAAATSSKPGVAGKNDAKAAGALALVAGGLVALLA